MTIGDFMPRSASAERDAAGGMSLTCWSATIYRIDGFIGAINGIMYYHRVLIAPHASFLILYRFVDSSVT